MMEYTSSKKKGEQQEMLKNISKGYEQLPFLWIRQKEHECPFIREYVIIYVYKDGRYYQRGNTNLKPSDNDIKRIFKELTTKTKTKTKFNPETKIYLNFPKTGIEQEIHKGIGTVTTISFEGDRVTDVILKTIYRGMTDLFNQPLIKEMFSIMQ